MASSGGASSVVGDGVTMTEKRNLYLYLNLYPTYAPVGSAIICSAATTAARKAQQEAEQQARGP